MALRSRSFPAERDDGKSGIASALLALMLLSSSAHAEERAVQAPRTIVLSVEASGALPGLRVAETSAYLAAEMAKTHVEGWRFVAAAPATSATDRAEWRFRLNPYAGGNVRQIIPIPALKHAFGSHHLLTAELRLFLDGDYQTMTFGEATIDGGAADKALASLVAVLTENLLGPQGAYRAIDTNRGGNNGRAAPR